MGPRKARGPRFALCFFLLRRSNGFLCMLMTRKLGLADSQRLLFFCFCFYLCSEGFSENWESVRDAQTLGGECFAPHLHFARQSEVSQVVSCPHYSFSRLCGSGTNSEFITIVTHRMQLALQVGLTYFILTFCFSCHLFGRAGPEKRSGLANLMSGCCFVPALTT